MKKLSFKLMILLMGVLAISVFASCSNDEEPDWEDIARSKRIEAYTTMYKENTSGSIYNRSLHFKEQFEVDYFPKAIKTIKGSIKIGQIGKRIIDLTPLQNIETIEKKLDIFYVAGLVSLDGLNPKKCKKIIIKYNHKLKDISSLRSIENKIDYLEVTNNTNLTDLSVIKYLHEKVGIDTLVIGGNKNNKWK